jgi:D-alanyl-D-alanine carboxypeptidase
VQPRLKDANATYRAVRLHVVGVITEFATMADLNRFYRALLTGRLLSPALLAQMQTTVPFEASMPEQRGYGLGLYWLPTPCGPAWGHNGGVLGYSTDSYHSVDARRQVSAAQNANSAPLDQAYEVHGTFLGTALCGPQPTPSGAANQAPARLLTRIRRTDRGRPPSGW